ncbi:2'-5' RNA ligase family protein [Streptomyces sp. NPDC101151]|uniref:2'-5' RNA ligase family protein n=1 Tax=Streptomyces sp. NPDC101151 TaxID=3366115 RepID=UPI00381BBA9A
MDEPARAGLPAHITVLYPFLPFDRIDSDTLDSLQCLVLQHGTFDVAFAGFGRFPNALWLTPDPAESFRALTEAIGRRRPEAPPHGGRFPEVVPHLTVASDQSLETYAQVEAEPAPALPVTARIERLHLMISDGTHWHDHAVLRLGAGELS